MIVARKDLATNRLHRYIIKTRLWRIQETFGHDVSADAFASALLLLAL